MLDVRLAHPIQPVVLNQQDDPLKSSLHVDGKARQFRDYCFIQQFDLPREEEYTKLAISNAIRSLSTESTRLRMVDPAGARAL